MKILNVEIQKYIINNAWQVKNKQFRKLLKQHAFVLIVEMLLHPIIS